MKANTLLVAWSLFLFTPLTVIGQCEDSDKGSVYLFGIVEDNGVTYGDVCKDSRTLMEATCSTERIKTVPCASGCVDGACKLSGTPPPLPNPSATVTPSPSSSPSPTPTPAPKCYLKLTYSEIFDAVGNVASAYHTLVPTFGEYEGAVHRVPPGEKSPVEVETYAKATFDLTGRYTLPVFQTFTTEIVASVQRGSAKRYRYDVSKHGTKNTVIYLPYDRESRMLNIKYTPGLNRVSFPDKQIPLLETDFAVGGKLYCSDSQCASLNASVDHPNQRCCAGLTAYPHAESGTKYTCGKCGDGVCAAFEDFLTCSADCK